MPLIEKWKWKKRYFLILGCKDYITISNPASGKFLTTNNLAEKDLPIEDLSIEGNLTIISVSCNVDSVTVFVRCPFLDLFWFGWVLSEPLLENMGSRSCREPGPFYPLLPSCERCIFIILATVTRAMLHLGAQPFILIHKRLIF